MKLMQVHPSTRHGAVAPLLAVLMVVILAMVAFAVDIGWMVLVQSELQNAADAAALAGSGELGAGLVTLANEKRNYYATSGTSMPAAAIDLRKAQLQAAEVTSARATAQRLAGLNKAGGVDATVPNGRLSTDVRVGYTDSAGTTTWFSSGTVDALAVPPVYSASWPNTVEVTVRRDDLANSRLKLFFAPVIGVNEQALSAVATASRTFIANPNTFSAGGANGTILPVAIHKDVWDRYYDKGQKADGRGGWTTADDNFTRTYNGTISGSFAQPASDGIKELQIYTDIANIPGNFGQSVLVAQDMNNATGNTENWIRNGPSGADLQTFADADGTTGLVVPTTGRQFHGDPGLQTALEDDFAAIVGQSRLVPLYAAGGSSAASGGTGNNSWYNIVGFAPVTVVYAGGSGSNFKVMVQAAEVVDPTATSGTGTDGNWTMTPPRLR